MEINYNKFSFKDIYYPNEPICRRAKVDIGLRCNANCGFCYYKHNLNDKELSFDIIKSRIDFLSKYTDDFDISGGEPTIHSKFFDIIKYCKSKSENTNSSKVSCLTNGIKFQDIEFMKKAQQSGLSEILFSLHSVNEIHDNLTGIKGSFDKILKSINNAKELGIKVRINAVVTNSNYKFIDNLYFDLLENINPFELNFLPLNYFSDAENNEKIDYNILLEPIKKFILKSKIKYINVRYVPYCFMIGFEKHVVGYFQHIYDIYDWNSALYDYLEPTLDNMINCCKNAREHHYYKNKDCFKCKYFNICDGVEKQIKDIKLNPIIDNKITNIIEFRSKFYD